MSFFHCPVGASSKGTEECISCGMCTALTREEQKKAADIVRAYLRSNVSKRLSRYVIKKIAVCGKGGAGTSTVAAMMAIALRDMGYEVLVIDTDESNSGLHRKLGIDDLPKPLLSFIDRFNDGVAEDSSWLDNDSLKIEDIPETFITTNNIDKGIVDLKKCTVRAEFSSVQSLSCVRFFATPWTAATRPPCSSPTPGVYSNSWPLSR